MFSRVHLSTTLRIPLELFMPKSQYLLKTSLVFIWFFFQKRHLCLVLVFITQGRLLLLQQVYCYRSSVKQSASSLQLSLFIPTISSKVPTLPTEFLFSLFPILEIVSRNKKHEIILYSWWINKVSQLLGFLHSECRMSPAFGIFVAYCIPHLGTKQIHRCGNNNL